MTKKDNPTKEQKEAAKKAEAAIKAAAALKAEADKKALELANKVLEDESELYEIDSVRVYQAVTFDKRSETFFSTRVINGKPARTIKMNTKYGGVEIISEMDHILVPFANISCIYFLSELKKQQRQEEKDSKAKKVGVRASEIKRPGS